METKTIGELCSADEAFVLIPSSHDLPTLGATSEIQAKELIAKVRLFCPYSPYTCYLIEYDNNARVGYAMATLDGGYWEFGTISIQELEEIRLFDGLVKAIERDLHFKPTPLGEIEELQGHLPSMG